MWNPDNSEGNKSEESIDCSCIGEEQQKQQQQKQVAMSNNESTVKIQQKQQKACANNSKDDNKTPGGGGGCTAIDGNDVNKLFDIDEQHTENSDSGFISGPQSQGFGESKEEQEKNQKGKQQQSQFSSTNQQEKKLESILDSGCINEEIDDQGDSTTDKYIKSGVDALFSNLSLQEESLSRQQQQASLHQQVNVQQLQQQVNNMNINNFDEVGRRVVTPSLYTTQKPASNCDTTNSNSTMQLNPSNAWEKFYQQNDDGDTPLHLACLSGYVDVVSALIRMAPHPCLFNIQNDEAQTPLHLAAFRAHPKILRMLLIAGAEPTIRDSHGNTALHLACMTGEEQCVRALTIPISASEINEAHRQYGHRSNDKTVSYLSCARLPSDMEIRNYDGERCVHLAAQAGYIDILRILVLYGADINAREGKSGRTPLHISMESSNEELMHFLLDECQKLNLETVTYAGLTAYQTACILNKSRMQNILVKRGAEELAAPDSDYDSDSESDLDDSKTYDRFGDPGYFVNYNSNGGNPMTVA